MTGFTHLHCHGAHSFLDGASGIGDLVARAAALGMEALALTDTNGLYGAVPFCLAARAAGVRPIVGAECATRRRAPSSSPAPPTGTGSCAR